MINKILLYTSRWQLIEAEPNLKKQKRDTKQSSKNKYHSPKKTPRETKLTTNQTEEDNTTNQFKLSTRIPKVSAKYLESIKAELQDSDDD